MDDDTLCAWRGLAKLPVTLLSASIGLQLVTGGLVDVTLELPPHSWGYLTAACVLCALLGLPLLVLTSWLAHSAVRGSDAHLPWVAGLASCVSGAAGLGLLLQVVRGPVQPYAGEVVFVCVMLLVGIALVWPLVRLVRLAVGTATGGPSASSA